MSDVMSFFDSGAQSNPKSPAQPAAAAPPKIAPGAPGSVAFGSGNPAADAGAAPGTAPGTPPGAPGVSAAGGAAMTGALNDAKNAATAAGNSPLNTAARWTNYIEHPAYAVIDKLSGANGDPSDRSSWAAQNPDAMSLLRSLFA